MKNLGFIFKHYEREETKLKKARAQCSNLEIRRKIDIRLDFVSRIKGRFIDLLQGDCTPKVIQRKLEEIYAESMPDF